MSPRLSGRLSLHPLVLCIHYRSTFSLMETLESFTLLPYIMSLKLLPHLAQTFFPSIFLPVSTPAAPTPPVCLRSSPIISRRHHITHQLVAGNQSACLTSPDGPPPPPSRPCSSSSSSPLISRCLPVLLHVSRIITLRSPRTIRGYLSSACTLIGGRYTLCSPRGLKRVPRWDRRSEHKPSF